jgi:radical SAM protein with 4Fe4S-binding SPASM domain
MYWINNWVLLVEGFKNSAIYDFKSGKVFSINDNAYQIIEKKINNLALKKSENNYIDRLIENHLWCESFCPSKYQNNLKYSPELHFSWLEITNLCNLRCVHCYKGEENNKQYPNQLDINQWRDIIDQLSRMNCKSIQFIGGEPLLCLYLNNLIQYAYFKGIRDITVFTNGTLINEDFIKIFKEYNVKIRVSLYGQNSEVHERVTQIKKSFEDTKNALIKLKNEKIPTTVSVIIMKENEDYIEEIKTFINNLGYSFDGFDIIRQVHGECQYHHFPQDINIVKQRVRYEPDFYSNYTFFRKALIANSCWNGKWAITVNGEVIPCIFERNIVFGNIHDKPLQEILGCKKTEYYWTITKDKIKYCKLCEYRYCCKDCLKITNQYPLKKV